MAKAPKLKVFVTPIGFHDAYVAAPSQKAALDAWGTGTDLFGTGRASRVEAGDAHDAALAQPGTVVKRLRGSEAAMLDFEPPPPAAPAPARRRSPTPAAAATPRRKAARPAAATREPEPEPKPKREPRPEPPDRSRLAAAEEALARAERDLADELARIAAERRALDDREAAVTEAASGPLGTMRGERDAARSAYEASVAAFGRRR